MCFLPFVPEINLSMTSAQTPITCSLAHHFKLKMKPFLAHSLSTSQFQSHIFGGVPVFMLFLFVNCQHKKRQRASHKQYTKRNINRHENLKVVCFRQNLVGLPSSSLWLDWRKIPDYPPLSGQTPRVQK